MRPTYYDEGRFNVGIVGTNWDPVDLMDQTKFVKFIRDNTGHPELKISNFTSMTYWKSVTPLLTIHDRRLTQAQAEDAYGEQILFGPGVPRWRYALAAITPLTVISDLLPQMPLTSTPRLGRRG